MFDPVVSPRVRKARELWLKARVADLSCWPDVASGYREGAEYWMRLARYAKRERIRARVYGTMINEGAA